MKRNRERSYSDHSTSKTYLRELLYKFETNGSVIGTKRSDRPNKITADKMALLLLLLLLPQVACFFPGLVVIYKVVTKHKLYPHKLKRNELSDGAPAED